MILEHTNPNECVFMTNKVNITLCLQAWVLEWEVVVEGADHPVMDKNKSWLIFNSIIGNNNLIGQGQIGQKMKRTKKWWTNTVLLWTFQWGTIFKKSSKSRSSQTPSSLGGPRVRQYQRDHRGGRRPSRQPGCLKLTQVLTWEKIKSWLVWFSSPWACWLLNLKVCCWRS